MCIFTCVGKVPEWLCRQRQCVLSPGRRFLESEKSAPKRNHKNIHENLELPMTECLFLKYEFIAVALIIFLLKAIFYLLWFP